MVLVIVMVVKGYGFDGECSDCGDDFDVDLNDCGGGDDDVFDSDNSRGNGDDIGGSGCGGMMLTLEVEMMLILELGMRIWVMVLGRDDDGAGDCDGSEGLWF